MRDSVPGLKPPCPTRLLLILGAPASGKSLLAERLAARYGALALRKDEIKEVLFDTLGVAGPALAAATGAWSRALSDASFALLFAFAHRLRSSGRTLLLEGNFRPGEHEPAIAALLADHEMPLAQILCHARPETLIARLEARANDPTRHRGHRDHESAARLRRGVPETQTRFLALPGLQLHFDGEAPSESELARLCSALDPWMGLAAPR